MSYPEIKPNGEIQTQSEKNRDANQFTENVRYSDAIGIHKPNYLSFSVFTGLEINFFVREPAGD